MSPISDIWVSCSIAHYGMEHRQIEIIAMQSVKKLYTSSVLIQCPIICIPGLSSILLHILRNQADAVALFC